MARVAVAFPIITGREGEGNNLHPGRAAAPKAQLLLPGPQLYILLNLSK